ncbi:MAG: zinc-dependent alcohol dehydrogenase family protein [Sphingomonadales bacterium]|nr:zinc-dependent alcohol dehydrogenase family protein [Sphingomonadales bacterium]
MPRALRIHGFTGIEGIQMDEVPMPEPAGREVRLRVEAFALNYGDLGLMEDDYVFSLELPSCFGDEAAGIVDAVGPEVTRFRPGDRVSTVTFRNEGYPVDAEYCLFPEDYLAAYPERLSAVEGTSIWVQYLTAYYAFFEVAEITENDFILVTAASSSAGMGATQLAGLAGAKVIGTTRTSANAGFIRETGAHEVIATEEEDVSARILEITDGKGVRVVYDPVGGKLTAHYADAFGQDAIVFLYGDMSREPTVVPIAEAIRKNAVIRPHSVYNFVDKPMLRERGIKFVYDALDAGLIKPLIDKVFPLDRFREAFEYQVAAKGRRGKIVIKIDG